MGQAGIVMGTDDLDRFLDRMRIARHETLEHDGDGAEPLGHSGWTPASPLFNAEVERQAFDHRREVGPQAAAILKFAEDRVVVFNQPKVDEAGEILAFRTRQVPPPADRSDDLTDQIEVVNKEALIIHEKWPAKRGKRLLVRAITNAQGRNTAVMTGI